MHKVEAYGTHMEGRFSVAKPYGTLWRKEGGWRKRRTEKHGEEEEEEELTDIENLTYRSLNVNRTLRLSFFLFPLLLL